LSSNRAAAVGAWLRLLLCLVARGFLGLLIGLAVWAIAPDVLGWHTAVVMTGSMEPRVQPGDALVYQPVAASDLRPGQVIIVHDPAHPGRLLSHRMTKQLSNGELITRGDANPAADSTPVKPDAVLGLARLRVQYIGLPWKWLHQGQPGLAFGALLLLVAAITAAGSDLDTPDDTRKGGHHENKLRSWALGTAHRLRTRTLRSARRLAFSLPVALALTGSVSSAFGGFTGTTVNNTNSFAAAASFCTSPSSPAPINPNADSYVDSGSTGTNHGSDGTLYVQSQSGQNLRTLANFTLPTLPAGCSITSATLVLTVDSGTAGRTLQAFRATASWTEGGVNWTNQPATTGSEGAATAPSAAGSNTTVSFTVTSQVQAMYPSSAFGFVVKDSAESSGSQQQQKYNDRLSGKTPIRLTLVIG